MHSRMIHALAVLLAVGVTGCSRPAAPPPPPIAGAPSDAIQAFNLASYADDGRKRWEVLGTTADMAETSIHLTDVTATAFGDKTDVTVTAREGTFDRERQHVELHQDVKAVTTEGTTLTTDRMTWDADRQIAASPTWTKVQRAGLTVQGQGATATPQFKTVQFHEQVQVDIQPSTTITCRGPLFIDYEQHRATFRQAVHVRDPRGDLWTDRMDVDLDPKTQKISRVRCWGHVKIRRETQVARARRAQYETRTGVIVLLGHPQITYSTTPGRDGRPSA